MTLRKILILTENVSETDYVDLAKRLALVCDTHAQERKCDILVIAGSLDPHDWSNPDPAAN